MIKNPNQMEEKNMEEMTNYQGKKPENYAQAVLFLLANYLNDPDIEEKEIITSGKVVDLATKAHTKPSKAQVTAAMNNFTYLYVVKKISPGNYQINSTALNDILKKVLAKNRGVWASKEEVAEYRAKHPKTKKPQKAKGNTRPEPRKATIDSDALIIRAIFAAFNRVLSKPDISKLAREKLDKVLAAGAARNILFQHAECFNRFESGTRYTLYGPNSNFFAKFIGEKDLYVELFPDKKDIILKRFENPKAPLAPDLTGALTVQILRAVFAAYEKELTLKNVVAIAEKAGYQIKLASIRSWVNKHRELFHNHGTKGMREIFWSANESFFKQYLGEIEIYQSLFKDKADTILGRFNSFIPEETKAHEMAHGYVEPSEPKEDETFDIEPDEEISAADVGASILAYVVKLKRELRKQKAGHGISENGHKKIGDLQSTIIGLRQERNDVIFENNKLKSIVNEKDRRINAMKEQLGKLEAKLERMKAPKETFKLKDVAHITRLVKTADEPQVAVEVSG
jgi:hypothetical protein